jgi:hypothetical protein
VLFFAPVPSEIEETDCPKDWWPRLKGFPLNILYMGSTKTGMASALYVPDLKTFWETDTGRELTYRNKLGGAYQVHVVLNRTGGIETHKYRGVEEIAVARGKDFDTAMTQTTMIGIQNGEPVDLILIAATST